LGPAPALANAVFEMEVTEAFTGSARRCCSSSRGQVRLLYRLWLSMPNSGALPPGHEVLWGSIEPGALRGGIGQVPAV